MTGPFLRRWLSSVAGSAVSRRAPRPLCRPTLDRLEDRLVPYAVSGYQWANTNVSASFMPDGTTTDSGAASNLFATLNAIAPTATWQREFARALQTWADVTPLNFHFVSDSGAPVGTSGSVQGDSRFGDIRLGAYARNDGYVGYTYYPAGGTLGGDEFLASNATWHIGTDLDFYSVLLHESGHAIGLAHSTLSTAVMYPSIMGVYTGLSADDIAGIQAIYGARQPDAYDAAASNDTFASATSLSVDGSGAVSLNADLTSLADVDYYRVTAPASFDGTLTVSVDARNLSLLAPKISVYDSAQHLLGTFSAGTYGDVATVSLSGLVAGQTYYLVADGATGDVFGMGAYRLQGQFGGVAAPPPLPSLSINNVSRSEGNSGTAAFTFTVTLSAGSTGTVTVQYATADGTATAGSDYVATSGALTFAPGETQKTISVSVNGDTTYEPDETFVVNLSNPTNATLGTSQGQGTILNDDVGPDRYEVNNLVASASNLGKGNSISQTNLTLHTTADVDYYKFTPTKTGTFSVSVTATQGGGTLNVSLLNSSQVVVASGQTTSGALTLSVSLNGNKQYYVKVCSSSGNLFGYNLSISRGGAAIANSPEELGDGTETNVERWLPEPASVDAANLLPGWWTRAAVPPISPGPKYEAAVPELPPRGASGAQVAFDLPTRPQFENGLLLALKQSTAGRTRAAWEYAEFGSGFGSDDS